MPFQFELLLPFSQLPVTREKVVAFWSVSLLFPSYGKLTVSTWTSVILDWSFFRCSSFNWEIFIEHLNQNMPIIYLLDWLFAWHKWSTDIHFDLITSHNPSIVYIKCIYLAMTCTSFFLLFARMMRKHQSNWQF